MSEVLTKCRAAKAASTKLAAASGSARNAALLAMAAALREHSAAILAANGQDMEAARAAGTPAPLLDRLLLTQERIEGIADALVKLSKLDDPLGEVVEGRTLYNGIQLTRRRVPLGVVAMIYEARPNVTADTAGLCIKTGNACVLRGGSLAVNSCVAMARVLAAAAEGAGMPAGCIQIVESTDRAATTQLMEATGLVDVLIPRGGAGLIRACVENAKVPVIETGVGNCHVYVHTSADMNKAVPIVVNAKTQRPGVCNAAESLLVDEGAADAQLPALLVALARKGVAIHADEHAARLAAELGIPVQPATEDDWGTEYLDLEISVKCVAGLDEAIAHINRYGTGHSECIVAQDADAILRFTNEVDAAAVYANASTRFTDGGEFGLGAEIGISTQKLHARGPMGLRELTSTKFVLLGSGQVRE
ncbi:MAG: glutamate-5-semialdehyde dehydrogenase [Coriobacteriales bacterium]